MCARAIAFDVVDVARVERLLKTAKTMEEADEARGRIVPMPSRFARDPAAFATRTSTTDGGAQ